MGKLVVLIITAFVDMLGLLMVLPLLPFYARDLVHDGCTVDVLGMSFTFQAGFIVGLLVASFSIAQLLSAPMWGRFSDKYGRRPALLVGLGAAGVAYVIFAFADSLWLLFLSRLVQGAGGGTVGVIQAYVADSTAPENRARSLGWLSAATNAGVALGPVLGSLSQGLGRSAAGLIAAGIVLLNLIFAWKFLHESHDVSDPARRQAKGASRAAVWRVVTHSAEPAPRLIWIYAIAMGAFQGMTAILALFLADRFGVTEKTIWIVFTYIAVISVIVRAGVLGWAVDRYGEAKLSRIGSSLLALGLATMPFTHTYPWLAMAVALVPLGTAFTFPCVTSMLSRVIGSHERGLYMGVQQTFGGIARAISPIWAGWAFDHLGHGVVFWTSATLVAGTIFLGLDMEDYVRPGEVATPRPPPGADTGDAPGD